MDIVRYISTPKNTADNNPLLTSIKLTRGRLTGGSIYFPSGPSGTLHIILKKGVHQILPFNTGQNIALDDCVIPLCLGFDLLEPPFLLTCHTWNDSTLYDHALTLVLHLDTTEEQKIDIKTIIEKYWELRNY